MNKIYDIKTREFLMNECGCERHAEIPEVTMVKINDKPEPVIKWWPLGDKIRQMFFPITKPQCPEWEYSSPDEWMVIFIGTLKDYKQTMIAKIYSPIEGKAKNMIALLKTKRSDLIGLDGKPMGNRASPCTIISRAENGKLFKPEKYLDPYFPSPHPLVAKELYGRELELNPELAVHDIDL